MRMWVIVRRWIRFRRRGLRWGGEWKQRFGKWLIYGCQIGGAMNDDGSERKVLSYQQGEEDLRPVRETDAGCAFVFAVIALASLVGIAAIAGFGVMKRSIRLPEVMVIILPGAFCGGIDHCGDWAQDAASVVGE